MFTVHCTPTGNTTELQTLGSFKFEDVVSYIPLIRLLRGRDGCDGQDDLPGRDGADGKPGPQGQ